jgi:hypothetical protein
LAQEQLLLSNHLKCKCSDLFPREHSRRRRRDRICISLSHSLAAYMRDLHVQPRHARLHRTANNLWMQRPHRVTEKALRLRRHNKAKRWCTTRRDELHCIVSRSFPFMLRCGASELQCRYLLCAPLIATAERVCMRVVCAREALCAFRGLINVDATFCSFCWRSLRLMQAERMEMGCRPRWKTAKYLFKELLWCSAKSNNNGYHIICFGDEEIWWKIELHILIY